MSWEHPTGQVPENVALVALGGSRSDYDLHAMRKGQGQLHFDEIWTVNRGARLMHHDLVFIMDDLKRESFFDAEYGDWIRDHDRPIITSTAYPEFATDHQGGIYAYPLMEIAAWCWLKHVRCYLKNSIPEMIAYAAFIGVKRLLIHGADYTLPNGQVMEPSRANVEYWIGVAESLGVEVGISPQCRLLGRSDFDDAFVYGYDLLHEAQRQIREGQQIGQQIQAQQLAQLQDEQNAA